ncbi:MAG: hypothetical protein HY900_25215 [Deltaproteobacteria bacterium]|nr:hypothetical protein [Deltaproteobacteria bacterium]
MTPRSDRDTGDRMGVEVDAVTEMLERALAQLSTLPPPKQDEVAAWLLAEHRGGLTEPLDPEEL